MSTITVKDFDQSWDLVAHFDKAFREDNVIDPVKEAELVVDILQWRASPQTWAFAAEATGVHLTPEIIECVIDAYRQRADAKHIIDPFEAVTS